MKMPDRKRTVRIVFLALALVALISMVLPERNTLEKLRGLRIEHGNPQPIVQTMTVQQAFALVPKEYVPFDPARTHMAPEEAAYLKSLFDLVNIGVIERVSLMQSTTSEANAFKKRNHGEILRRLDRLPYPTRLERPHRLILNAVYEQKQYFDLLAFGSDKSFNPGDALVVSSHRKLVQAYEALVDIYGDEDEDIHQSFYHELCALSFL